MVGDAAAQAWPPFVLVAGLLLVGLVAHADGVFTRAGELLEAVPGPPQVLFGAGAVLVVVVTAILNLDTAVVFLTPVLVVAARRRGVDEEPFVYAAVFMANAGSLFLPGSNLTNLLVLAEAPVAGGRFAAEYLPVALAAAGGTLLGLLVLFRDRFADGMQPSAPHAAARARPSGVLAALAAGVLVVALRAPALPVLALGLLASAQAVARGRVTAAEARAAVAPRVLAGLFAAAVALGVLARAWNGPAALLDGAGVARTAVVGALAAVGTNNLPAAVLLSAGHVAHPQALLVGLDLGPNLAVTGSLSAFLWMRVARQAGARTSARRFSRLGVVLAPLGIAAALLAAGV